VENSLLGGERLPNLLSCSGSSAFSSRRCWADVLSHPTFLLRLQPPLRQLRVSGELLGWPVVVRFTPVAYQWGYGDGSGRSIGVAGGASALQFSPTETSHRYAKPGRYTVTLQVDYRVELWFDGGTFDDIDGRVSSRAASKTVEVFTVSPLLEAG